MGTKGSPVQDGSGDQAEPVPGPEPEGLAQDPASLADVYTQAPIGLCHFDLDLRCVHINEWLAALNGLSVDDHLGQTVGDVLPDAARSAEEHLRQVITTGEPIDAGTVEARTPAQPGIKRTFQHDFYPVKSPEGTVVGVSCAVRDVTNRATALADVRDTSDLQQIEEQLAQSVAALEVANRELEAYNDTLTHGLRSPMLIVTNFSQRLREALGDSLGEQEADDLDRIQGAGRQMIDILDDLRDLGDVNRFEINPETVDFSAMGQTIIDHLGSLVPDRSVAFEVEAGIKVLGDRRLLKILLTNLLENAWKYTGRRNDAWIELGVVEDEDNVPIYHVRDNGIGFDNADSERIFGVFEQLDSLTESSGNGLGLATAERIVHRHGGRVWADGVPGEGAVFRFTLAPSGTEPS